uniref:TIL domain containing protein n=1 Tax=Rhipicephalus zambeziensis TaxID=60191 RepID=A0A224YPC8_9ACAR
MCSSACPVTYNMTMPFCSRMCVPGCDCPPGWVVDRRNWKRCVKANKFPPICPPHSTFKSCVSNCLPRCGIITPKTCISSCHRGACVCDEGFAEFWGYQGRVCVRQERCEWHYRNLLMLISTGSSGAGAALPGGAIHPSGWVIGPWGAYLPSVIGLLPASGSAVSTSTNALSGASSGGRGRVTPLSITGAPGSVTAGSGVVGVGMHGVGVNAPAEASSGGGISSSGGTGNYRGGAAIVLTGGRSGPHSGVAGGNSISPAGAVGAGISPNGGSAPLSVSRESGVTGTGRGSSGVGFTGESLSGTATTDSAGVRVSGTSHSVVPGRSSGALTTGFVGAQPPSITIGRPSTTITNTTDNAVLNRGVVGVNGGSASLGAGSVLRLSNIYGNRTSASLSSGISTGGSGESSSAGSSSLSSSTRVGGSSDGFNAGGASFSNSAGHGGSGARVNVEGTSLNGGAGIGGPGVGGMPIGTHFGGNNGVAGLGVGVITGGESLSSSGRVSVHGGAVPTEGAHLGSGAFVGGTRGNIGDAGIPLVAVGSGRNTFSGGLASMSRNVGVLNPATTTGLYAATASAANIRNGGGSAGGRSVTTGSGGAVVNGNVAGGLTTGGIGAVTPLSGSTVSAISGGGSAGRHSATSSGRATGTSNFGTSTTGDILRVTPNTGNTVSINGAGRTEGHPVATGSGSGAGNGNNGELPTGGIVAATHNAGGTVGVTHSGHSVPGGTIVRVETLHPSVAGNGGHSNGVLHVSTSRNTVGEGTGHTEAGRSLTTGPASTVVTTVGETATGTTFLTSPVSGNGASLGGAISMAQPGAFANSGTSAAPHSETPRIPLPNSSSSTSGNGISSITVSSSGSDVSMGTGNSHSNAAETNIAAVSGIIPTVTSLRGDVTHGTHEGSSRTHGTLGTPGGSTTTGASGSVIADVRGGSASVHPAGMILTVGTGSEGNVNRLTPVAAAPTAVTGTAGVGRGGAAGPVISISPTSNIPGGAAIIISPGATAGVANAAGNILPGSDNTGGARGAGTGGLTIHTGRTTSMGATGSRHLTTALRPAGVLEGGNGSHGGVSLVLQPGAARSSTIVYGLPPGSVLPIVNLRSNDLSSGGAISRHSSGLNSVNGEGVDIGESQPITGIAALGASNVSRSA